MSELTDDQLDGLFRKSAEEFKPPFDPAAWQDMESRLDANDPVVPTGGVSLTNNILRWGLPTVLLLLLVGWFFYKSGKSTSPVTISTVEDKPGTTKLATNSGGRPLTSNQPNKEEVTTIQPMRTLKQVVTGSKPENGLESVTSDRSTSESYVSAAPIRPANTRVEPEKVRTTKHSEKKENDYSESEPTLVTEREKTVRTPLTQSSYTANDAQITAKRSFFRRNRPTDDAVDKKRRVNTTDDELISTKNNAYQLKAKLVSGKQRDTNTGQETLTNDPTGSGNELSASINGSTAIVLSGVTELAILPAKWSKPLLLTNRPVEVHPDTTAGKIASQPAFVRGLSVRLAVSPDLSGIGLKNFARPGTNIGLLLEYRLSQHWSIQSGVIQSTKVYKAFTSEYTVPAGLWQPPFKLPESVDGRCTIFDIPINIRYDVSIKPRQDGAFPTRWFINGGVTSYIMNKENYHYTYPPHTYNQPEDRSESTGGYGFSHVNVSMGYERSISRRLSWQIEPFVKMPLKGVGFFKVNLSSTGAFFSLRYKL